MRASLLLGCLVAGGLLVGCSDSAPAGDVDPLRDADEVAREEAAADSADGTIGEPVNVGTLNVIVSDISYLDDVDDNGTDDIARIKVTLRVENNAGEAASGVEFHVGCANNDKTSGWYVDSTYEQNADLPAKTFREGFLALGVPADCDAPYVRVNQTGMLVGKRSTADFPIPQAVIDQFVP